jgi:beta-lactamase regulating signal transducer with metallopeptidase domain
MGVFLLFYKLLLEKENMHVFKRFYLLLTLTAALIIPSVVFVEYVAPIATSYEFIQATNEAQFAVVSKTPTDIDIINWTLLAWTIYGIGAGTFGIRFFKNLIQILNRIRKNTKLKQHFTIKVLLLEQLPPHTFFRYIFLNKEKFETNTIPKEVLLHEEIHAKQRHSLDVVFIELLQAILWFNPLLYFFKKSIKLNHEFLADSAVIAKDISTSNYQNTLLSYLSQDSLHKYQSVKMANAINYSSIKKRFKVMKTQTSKKAVLLRSILILPLFAFLLFAFSTKKEEILSSNEITALKADYRARSIEITILNKGLYLVEGVEANRSNLVEIVNTLHDDITSDIRKKIMNIRLKSDEEISREEVWFFYNSLMNYGFHRLVTAEQEVILSKGNTPLAIENKESASNLFQLKNTPKGATKTQLATYNALAKKYNEMSRDAMKISMKDVEQLKYIYSIMSDKQKADAEPFPDFPEPPPFPKTPKAPEQEVKNSNTGFLEVNGQTIFYVSKKGENAYYNRWGQKVNRKGEIISKKQAHAEKIIEGQVISKVYKDNKVVVEFNTDNVSIAPPLPPLPPEPIEPLDFIITMAKKGADFYYEGKKINSDKAIELFKKNKSLNINSSGINSKTPWVKITKAPVTN